MLPSIIDFRGRYHQDHRQRGGNKGVTDLHSSMKICLLKARMLRGNVFLFYTDR